MTEDIIKRAEAVLEGVTPGPWRVFIDDTGGKWTGWPLSIEATSITDKTVVRTGGQWPYEWDAKTSQKEAIANARFIAAARDLIPDILAAQNAALARVAKLEDALALADAALSGANMNMRVVEKTVRAALTKKDEANG
jgi:hypothetical protein